MVDFIGAGFVFIVVACLDNEVSPFKASNRVGGSDFLNRNRENFSEPRIPGSESAFDSVESRLGQFPLEVPLLIETHVPGHHPAD